MSQKKNKGATFEDPDQFKSLIRKNARLIGIDAGSKTLGLALSDTSLMIASALKTIRRTKFSHDAADLLQIADEHDVAGFVLGLPKNMDGSEGPRAQSARAFARNINALNHRPILLWDERLSTVAAERTLLEADTSRVRRSKVIDKLAATVILQNALDRMRIAP